MTWQDFFDGLHKLKQKLRDKLFYFQNQNKDRIWYFIFNNLNHWDLYLIDLLKWIIIYDTPQLIS